MSELGIRKSESGDELVFGLLVRWSSLRGLDLPFQVLEDLIHHRRVGQEGDHSHRVSALTRTGAAATTLAAGACVAPRSATAQVRGVCHHDCPDSCAWIIQTGNGQALSIVG